MDRDEADIMLYKDLDSLLITFAQADAIFRNKWQIREMLNKWADKVLVKSKLEKVKNND